MQVRALRNFSQGLSRASGAANHAAFRAPSGRPRKNRRNRTEALAFSVRAELPPIEPTTQVLLPYRAILGILSLEQVDASIRLASISAPAIEIDGGVRLLGAVTPVRKRPGALGCTQNSREAAHVAFRSLFSGRRRRPVPLLPAPARRVAGVLEPAGADMGVVALPRHRRRRLELADLFVGARQFADGAAEPRRRHPRHHGSAAP